MRSEQFMTVLGIKMKISLKGVITVVENFNVTETVHLIAGAVDQAPDATVL